MLCFQTRKLVDLPWHNHSPEKERPHFRGAPTRRVPIKGKYIAVIRALITCMSMYLSHRKEESHEVKMRRKKRFVVLLYVCYVMYSKQDDAAATK
jgi:hypothetical protein